MENQELAKQIETLKSMIAQSESIVAFTGAGCSTESGVPDFRGAGGLYRQKQPVPPETILSHTFFLAHTQAFFQFYRAQMLCLSARPNSAHLSLAALEKQGKLKAVVTQNIDGLHQAAGSQEVLELHGSIYRNYCMSCGKAYSAAYIARSSGIPRCTCGGVVKPDVVLYEEALDNQTVERALSYIAHADMLLVGGTSLSVFPAASLAEYYTGRRLVLINQTATPMDARADLLIRAPIGQTLSRAVLEDES
jgi:NAD-dependent deacetylase